MFFKPDKLDAPPGIVQFDLKNIESGTHDLVIRRRAGLSGRGERRGRHGFVEGGAQEGEVRVLLLDPRPRRGGMKGTLTVS